MNRKLQTLEKLSEQWQDRKNLLDCFEFQTIDGGFIIVLINCCFEPWKRGVFFDIGAADHHSVYFSGLVKKRNGSFFFPFDLEFGPDHIDYYLQEVYSEIVDGYIIPNGIDLIE